MGVRFITRGINAKLSGRLMWSGLTGPGLSVSATSIPENTAPGTTIGVAVPVNASNPGAVSIVSQTLANALVMSGANYVTGSATFDYETTSSFVVTFQYSDDSGTHQFARTFNLIDVLEGITADSILILSDSTLFTADRA